MRTINLFIFVIIYFSLSFVKAQEINYSYKKLSSLINAYAENDERAMVFVNMYIDKAKKESNDLKVIAGYEEAVYYSRNPQRKLIYADSAVIISKRINNDDQIARAQLGKGIIYYYNIRNFKKALEQYIIAFKYSKYSTDAYLKNKVVYHLGVVKSYLGYYDESIVHFTGTANFFERSMNNKSIHENIRLNNESGYLNSIYRLSKSYSKMGLYKKEDSLIDLGLEKIKSPDQHSLEYGYFQKGRGIQLLREDHPDAALKHLILSRDILANKQDFASLATVNFYLGKLYWKKADRKKSLQYLLKVDSLVNTYHFITPEIRSSYEYLINHSKQSTNESDQLYFTNQLLKADSIINADFAKLSSKIKYEYDTDRLNEEKRSLLRKHKISRLTIIGVIFLASVSIFYLFYHFRKKERSLNKKYQQLMFSYKNSSEEFHSKVESFDEHVKSLYTAEQIEDVKQNLTVFEKKQQFIKKGLKLPDVAAMIGTNRSQLSYVLNENLNTNFPDYLKKLRINYIVNLMLNDKKYLRYTIESLADQCGMSNRQVFSKHFLEVTGMRPTDFIRKRLEELKSKNS